MPARHPADTNNDGVTTPEEKAAWQAANPGVDYGSAWQGLGGGNNFKTPWGTLGNPTSDPTADAKRNNLNAQGAAGANFAGVGEQGYGAMSAEAAAGRAQLGRYASGQESLSREQLRQGLQQNMAAQRSMAASASPQNAAMAARTAMNNNARSSAGMSGAAAMAGIAERQAANKTLADMILQQRQQDAQVALGSRGNAISGYGGVAPAGSWLDRWGGALTGGAAGLAKVT